MENLEIRTLNVEDTLQYEQLACIAFHSKNAGLADPQTRLAQIAEGEEKNLQNRTRQGNHRTRTGLFRDKQLLSTLTAHAFEVYFDGSICEMCGVGGVMSDPSAQKTGGVSKVLRHELAAMRQRGQLFSHLYPFQTSFYRKFGYTHCAFAVKWTIPAQFLPEDPGNNRLFDGSPEMRQAVRDIYNSFTAKYNLAVNRSDARWEGIFDRITPYSSGAFSYVCFRSGAPAGFLSYTVESYPDAPMTATVNHLYFSDPEALRSLLSHLGRQRSYISRVTLTLPADVDISAWLKELCTAYDKCNVHREILHQGASRVVDAEKVLRHARYLGAGTANIRILDRDCPWNDKTFHVEFDGRCHCVSEAENWDIQLDIADFTALILGSRNLSEVPFMDSVEILGNLENLQKIFYKKPLWVGDSF